MNVGHWWPHVAVQFFKKSKVARFVCIVSSRISASEEKLFLQCVKGKLSRDARSIKGMTINDLGAEEIFEMNLFFPGECLSKFIFFLESASQNFFPLESASQNLCFSGEGPPKYFFLGFLRPQPQIINGRPLNGKLLWISLTIIYLQIQNASAYQSNICLPWGTNMGCIWRNITCLISNIQCRQPKDKWWSCSIISHD